jgi:hypothetical protein
MPENREYASIPGKELDLSPHQHAALADDDRPVTVKVMREIVCEEVAHAR